MQNAVAFPGLSLHGLTNSSSAGIVFVTLKPFSERKQEGLFDKLLVKMKLSKPADDLSAQAIAGKIMMKLGGIQEARAFMFPPPAIMGLGTVGGFELEVEDRADLGYEALFKAMQAVQMQAQKSKELANVFSGFQINVPQLRADLDRTRAKQLGLSVSDVFDTMQIYLGSLYVNDFNIFGRTFQVVVQADAPFRDQAADIAGLKTRNMKGEMVPLGSVLQVTPSFGPDRATRYNGYRSASLNGSPGFGVSSGEAEAAMTKLLKETLPKGMSFDWTKLKYQEILAGNTALWIFPLCVLLVFMVLAAQYESLGLPLAVILIVPLGVFSAIFGLWFMRGINPTIDNNIFTQIGLMVLVGLACKNAILIVEFARELEHQGKGVIDAAVEASRLRLRPILMTSFAFIMGVVPLILASGAGSEMRHAMGLAVFSGMVGVTFFGLFLTPVFYVGIRLLGRKSDGAEA